MVRQFYMLNSDLLLDSKTSKLLFYLFIYDFIFLLSLLDLFLFPKMVWEPKQSQLDLAAYLFTNMYSISRRVTRSVVQKSSE